MRRKLKLALLAVEIAAVGAPLPAHAFKQWPSPPATPSPALLAIVRDRTGIGLETVSDAIDGKEEAQERLLRYLARRGPARARGKLEEGIRALSLSCPSRRRLVPRDCEVELQAANRELATWIRLERTRLGRGDGEQRKNAIRLKVALGAAVFREQLLEEVVPDPRIPKDQAATIASIAKRLVAKAARKSGIDKG